MSKEALTLDLAELSDMVGGDREIMLEVLLLFIDHTRNALQHLSNGIDRSELKASIQAAHTIRGSAAQIGATGLSIIAGNIEENSYDDFAELEPLLIELQKEWEKLVAQIDSVVAELQSYFS